jgi:hypothetical protein
MNILIKNLPIDDKRFDGIIALLNELNIDWSFQPNDGKPIVISRFMGG